MNRMTDAQCGQFWRAIYDYQIDGIEYAGDDLMVGMAFDGILPFMESCKAQYESVCGRNRENGKKGGRPKKNPETQNPVGFSECETENPDGFLGFQEKTQDKNPETQKSRLDLIRLDSIREDLNRFDSCGGGGGNNARACAQTTTAATGENKSAMDIVSEHYRSCISKRMSESLKADLSWALSIWSPDVVCYAIDSAVDAGKANGAYVSAILRCYQQAGVRNLDDAKARDRNHRLGCGSRADLPRDDIAHMFGDGVPQFIDTVGLMIEQGITGEKMQDAVLGGFPPS